MIYEYCVCVIWQQMRQTGCIVPNVGVG